MRFEFVPASPTLISPTFLWAAGPARSPRSRKVKPRPQADAAAECQYQDADSGDSGENDDDGFIHVISLASIVGGLVDRAKNLRTNTNGDEAPEDCGGIWGYPDFIQAIENPDHERHEELLEWIGGSFDPETFDPAAATKAMRKGLGDWRKEAGW
jgi:hypothetical protein